MQGSLLSASKMRMHRAGIALDERHVTVTPMTLCQHCSRRLQHQRALVTPDLRVLHAKCYQESGVRPTGAVVTG